MRPSVRATLSTLTAAFLLSSTALTAFAAVPTNDTPSGALAVAKGSSYEVDTTEATTDAIDAALNADCGAPDVKASVWFTFTATDDSGVLFDATQGSDEIGLMVVKGDPTAGGGLIDCGPTLVGIPTEAGATYYVMAFTPNAGQAPGVITLVVSDPPPAPTVQLTINPRGTAYKDGTAKVGGTYSCTDAAEYSEIFGELRQRVGRLVISGWFMDSPLNCDGVQHTWEAYVAADNGLFAGGKAASVTIPFVCGAIECVDTYLDQVVQLTRAGK